MGWIKSNDNSSIFLTWLYARGYNIYAPSIQSLPLFITFCQTFERCHIPLVYPSLLMCHIDRPIAWISSSLVFTGSLAVVLSLWRSDRNSMDSEEKMTLGGTELHHSSWQYKESHRCCSHGHLAPLAMEDSWTSTVLTRYKSMRLKSLRKSERTTARNPLQHKRWTYPCYRPVNAEHQQRWTHWWCTIGKR